MKVLVTGTKGQVASSLIERGGGRSGLEIVAVGRPALDLARPDTIAPALAAVRPDVVVSAAAYTAVDQAEDEPDQAYLINEDGAGRLAQAARDLGAPIVHLSTDYVFSGEGDGPYTEAMPTGPKSVYGASKLAGEAAVAAANPHHLIMRTAWVYSPFGKNFAKTMLRLAETRDQLNVVDDQHGNPTSALDIADAILAVLERWKTGVSATGLYHFAGTGDASWCEFARHIFAVSGAAGGPTAEVAGIATEDYPTKAARPKNSRLASGKFADDFDYSAPHWRDSAKAAVERLVTGQIEDRS